MRVGSPDGISVLIGRDRREMTVCSTTWSYKKAVICEPGGGHSLRTQPGWHPDPRLSASSAVRKKCQLSRQSMALCYGARAKTAAYQRSPSFVSFKWPAFESPFSFPISISIQSPLVIKREKQQPASFLGVYYNVFLHGVLGAGDDCHLKFQQGTQSLKSLFGGRHLLVLSKYPGPEEGRGETEAEPWPAPLSLYHPASKWVTYLQSNIKIWIHFPSDNLFPTPITRPIS